MEPESATSDIERAVVYLRGMPLGTFGLPDGDLVIATLEPTRPYESFVPAIRYLSEAFWARGFLPPRPGRVPVEALAPSADQSFELRDSLGRMLAVDFVNVIESPEPTDPPVVVVCRKHVNALVASALRDPYPRFADEEGA